VTTPEAAAQVWMIPAHNSGRNPLEAVDQVGHGDLRRVVNEQVHVVCLAVELDQFGLEVGADLPEDPFEVTQVLVVEYPPAVLRDKDQVDVEDEHAVPSVAHVVVVGHRPSVYCATWKRGMPTGCV